MPADRATRCPQRGSTAEGGTLTAGTRGRCPAGPPPRWAVAPLGAPYALQRADLLNHVQLGKRSFARPIRGAGRCRAARGTFSTASRPVLARLASRCENTTSRAGRGLSRISLSSFPPKRRACGPPPPLAVARASPLLPALEAPGGGAIMRRSCAPSRPARNQCFARGFGGSPSWCAVSACPTAHSNAPPSPRGCGRCSRCGRSNGATGGAPRRPTSARWPLLPAPPAPGGRGGRRRATASEGWRATGRAPLRWRKERSRDPRNRPNTVTHSFPPFFRAGGSRRRPPGIAAATC